MGPARPHARGHGLGQGLRPGLDRRARLPQARTTRTADVARTRLHRSRPGESGSFRRMTTSHSSTRPTSARLRAPIVLVAGPGAAWPHAVDRKSTRLNSSHVKISYAVV